MESIVTMFQNTLEVSKHLFATSLYSNNFYILIIKIIEEDFNYQISFLLLKK